MVCQMIAVGETTGALDAMLQQDRRVLRGRGRQRGRQPDGVDGADRDRLPRRRDRRPGDLDVPADLPAGLGHQPVGDGFGQQDLDPQALRTRLRVWQFARVTIVTVFLGALAASDLSEPNVEAPLRGITLLIVVAYVASVASAFAVSRIRRLHEFALGQVVFDIILNSAAVLLTGSLLSPMAVWYNLAIMGAAFVLRRHGAYAAAAISSITYGVLMNLVYYHALPTALGIEAPAPELGLGLVYHIAANIASFFSIALPVFGARRARREHPGEAARLRGKLPAHRYAAEACWCRTSRAAYSTTDADGVIQFHEPSRRNDHRATCQRAGWQADLRSVSRCCGLRSAPNASSTSVPIPIGDVPSRAAGR